MFVGEGKGPGYAIVWSLIALAFMIPTTWAACVGAVPWWGAAGVDVLCGGAWVWLMLTAQWARQD